MQFQVPQFIDVEDKIFGPLTLKQFLYLAGAGGLSFSVFFLLTLTAWVALTVVLMAIAAVLAFVRINGQTMIRMGGAAFRFLWFPRFYLWRYTAPGGPLPVIHDLPQKDQATNSLSPLKSLMLKFNTARGAVSR